MSRRPAPGAIGSGCTSPTRSSSARSGLGLPYVAFDVPQGTAAGIARFYREVMDTNADAGEDGDGRKAWVQVGPQQHLIFRETDRELPPYDQHHIQIYIADFSKSYRKLRELGLITIDVLEHEYRFTDIVDPETKKPLFTVEHEVRSMRHPLYGRPLVNRNPAQTNTDYHPGHDAMAHTTGGRKAQHRRRSISRPSPLCEALTPLGEVDAHAIGAALQHAILELALGGEPVRDVEPDPGQKKRDGETGEAGGEAPVVFLAFALEISMLSDGHGPSCHFPRAAARPDNTEIGQIPAKLPGFDLAAGRYFLGRKAVV